jgi:hypothetical protein
MTYCLLDRYFKYNTNRDWGLGSGEKFTTKRTKGSYTNEEGEVLCLRSIHLIPTQYRLNSHSIPTQLPLNTDSTPTQYRSAISVVGIESVLLGHLEANNRSLIGLINRCEVQLKLDNSCGIIPTLMIYKGVKPLLVSFWG